MNRYSLHKEPQTVKTPLDLTNMKPEFHSVCKSIHSLRGLEVSCTGKYEDGSFLVWVYAKEVRDLAPLARAIENRYGGHVSITLTCEGTDVRGGVIFRLFAPDEVLLKLVHKNLEFLKHDVISTNSRKFLEVQFSE